MTEPASLPLIVGFLRRIGLVVDERTLAEPTFLPGIRVERGGLVFDPYRLAHPGDLLHEAGHLAVVPPGQRATMDGAIDADPGEEMAAIAWSWAGAQDLGLAPEALFHADGYKGGSDALIENFLQGRYIGVPLLEWRGMTDWQQPCAQHSATRYPAMKRWLCP
ncbi:MAG: hypothetical protein AB1832_18070 [Pseudomonadota bacterium]